MTGHPQRWREVWITGASSGIGRALAEELATPERRLILSGRSEARLNETAEHCRDRGAEVEILAFDMGDAEAREAAIASLAGRGIEPDLLINNAGVSQRAPADKTPFAIDRRIIEVNLLASVHLTKALLPGMTNRGTGMIVTVSSIAGLVSSKLRSAYNAAKAAQIAYVRTMQNELHDSGVGLVLVMPGFVRTEVSGNALRGDGQSHGKLDHSQAGGIPPERAARKIVAGLLRGRKEIYVGVPLNAHFLLTVERFSPRIANAILRKVRV